MTDLTNIAQAICLSQAKTNTAKSEPVWTRLQNIWKLPILTVLTIPNDCLSPF